MDDYVNESVYALVLVMVLVSELQDCRLDHDHGLWLRQVCTVPECGSVALREGVCCLPHLPGVALRERQLQNQFCLGHAEPLLHLLQLQLDGLDPRDV